MIKLENVIYENKRFWVLKVKGGFEVYKTGVTHSTRCSQIGHTGSEGETRAIKEADRRAAIVS